ncbi:SusD/RagB family nutrient-binding outer membrane lipoprotein [Hymenobacter amundsenii]|uniref:SusD/RagB family nutrient-binding outer membrane lipoprotein n=1 Tax=Hymenobacter amundsenii TaxID=2006685 RepID=A0A246FMA2_9BACT|nr:SusD/RagB family nutrient-binding outer membrane lipoprotein [Hymenobacter amundsenii]OWP63852.1 SusD/RagB family nutrient-binding outer membrane lipoprotein [Hymenobacter amundsenii]
MKKSLFFILPAMVLATSCVDSLDDYNIDPKRASVVPSTSLVSSAERELASTLASANVNTNVFRLYVQYWAQTTYFDESIYDINTRNINRNFWSALYRDVLADLNEAKRLITADNSMDAKVKANQLAAIETLEVYTWAVLVDTYGNIPYSEALDFNKPQPKYDDAKTIYDDLIKRLDTAIGSFDKSAGGLGAADLYFNGDTGNFVKFANSLKLRLAMTIVDVDQAKAKTLVESTVGKLISSNEESAKLTFLGSNPNTNPLYVDLVQSGRYDFVGTNFFIDRLNTLKDPRLGAYFKPNGGTFKGGIYGVGNNYASFSSPGVALEDPTAPSYLLSYSQVEFLLAEASARGFAVGGTAASHYNNAVTASIKRWGGSDADATAYLAQPAVAYATATGDYKQKIGVQKWIALYGQPVDSYREFRRLDYPKLTKPEGALSNLPVRFPYPVVEQNLNTANNAAAAAAIGGDNVNTKIFWDKF